MSSSDLRKLAFKEFNNNVVDMMEAIISADYQKQLAYMEEAIKNLEKARSATKEICNLRFDN